MDTRRSSEDDWIKCQSKSKPGRCYMFNKSTGESKWCDSSPEMPKDETRKDKIPSPPKELNKELKIPKSLPNWEIVKQLKTPAQDRLKRLQTNLKTDSKHARQKSTEKNNNNKNKAVDQNIRTESAKQHDRKQATDQLKTKQYDRPTTSSAAVKKEKETKLVTTSTSKSKETQETPQKIIKKRPATDLPNIDNMRRAIIKLPRIDQIDAINYGCNLNEQERTHTWIYGNGIVNKITELCKNTFKNASRALEDGTRRVAKSNKKIPSKAAEHLDNPVTVGSAIKDVPKHLRRPTASKPATHSTTDKNIVTLYRSPSSLSTPTTLDIPAYNRGSANSRLERLRQCLQLEQKHNVESVPLVSPLRDNFNEIGTTQSPSSTYTNTTNDTEPMDWQSIDDNPAEKTKMLTLYPVSISPLTAAKNNSMSEHYDMVNENLLRLSAEKKRVGRPPTRWLERHYYFVVDTNVLLRHLTFLDDLSKMKLCDTNGTILYIPYMVLQELDKLKLRTVAEGTKTLALRSIKFLNEQLEANSQHFHAQSAIEERKHIIEITSPDDSIINCCLQMKQHVEHLILLTEDINLRTKALCNNLLVSSKSDLVSKHPNSLINATITINSNTFTNSITTSNAPAPVIK